MKCFITIIILSSNYKCKNWNVKSINCSYNVRYSMKSLKFHGWNLNSSWTWKLHKSHLQMNSNQSTKILNYFEIAFSVILYVFSTVHKVFPVPSFYNDIATLLSTKIISFICVFFLCKYGFNLSQRNLNVL